MGCCPCFDSKDAEELNPSKSLNEDTSPIGDEHPMVPPQVHRLVSG